MTYGASDEKAIRTQAIADGVTHFTTGVAVMRDGKILVVRRTAQDEDLGSEWELPGGGVDEGETIDHGAVRELQEETGLEVDAILSTFQGFDYTTAKKPKARQTNFRVTVKPGNIQLDPLEHDEFRWITANDIPSLKTNPVMQECLYKAFDD